MPIDRDAMRCDIATKMRVSFMILQTIADAVHIGIFASRQYFVGPMCYVLSRLMSAQDQTKKVEGTHRSAHYERDTHTGAKDGKIPEPEKG